MFDTSSSAAGKVILFDFEYLDALFITSGETPA